MFVCKRCVLTSRLLFSQSQDIVQMAKLCHVTKPKAQTGLSLVHQSFFHGRKDQWKCFQSQYFSEQQIRSSLNDSSVGPVNMHQTNSTPDSPFAENIGVYNLH